MEDRVTKKHFEAFAEQIARHEGTKEEQLAMARLIIWVAEDDNPRFDRDRFLKACGL